MTVSTVDSHIADMVFMAERDRLLADHARFGDVGGPDDFVRDPANRAETNTAPKMLTREIVFMLG